MPILCPACGKENRDKARFCRGCARPLEPHGEPGFDAQEAKRRLRALERAKRRRRNGHGAPTRASGGRRLAWAVLVAAGLGVGWWLTVRQPEPAQAAALPAPVAPARVALPAEAPASDTATATVSPESPELAVERLRHSVELLAQQDRDRAASQERLRARVEQERLRAEEARRRTDALAAAAVTAQAPDPATSTVSSLPPAATRSPEARAPSVDQACADRSNFISRDLCRIQACGNPAMAGDPVCVRFREMEAANRNRLGN